MSGFLRSEPISFQERLDDVSFSTLALVDLAARLDRFYGDLEWLIIISFEGLAFLAWCRINLPGAPIDSSTIYKIRNY